MCLFKNEKFITLPQCDTDSTTVWYSQYHGVVLSIPRCGTPNTTVWYSQYHGVVLSIPRRGNLNTTVWYSPYHAIMIFWYCRQECEISLRVRRYYGFALLARL